MSDQQKDPRNFGRRPEPRPVSHTSGERNFAKPAGERKPGERNFAKPAADRKPGERTFARPAAPRRQAPHGDGLAARRAAFHVLCEVAENGAYAAPGPGPGADPQRPEPGGSPPGLQPGVRHLENQLRLDWALKDFMRKDDTDMKLRVILRLGACQLLLYDKIPASAAVNTAVSLCKDAGMPGLAGVCNAILRGLDRDRASIVYPDPQQEPAQYLSVMYSLPLWLVERLMAAYGHDTAAAIAAYRQRDAGIK